MDTPRFPQGTPEYDAYFAALKEELRKFVAHEPPYDKPIEEIFGDPLEGTDLKSYEQVFKGGTKYDRL